MNYIQGQSRILAIAPSTRGFGFAVMEGENALIAWGVKTVAPGDKNRQSLTKVKGFIAQYPPDVLVLPDVAAKDANRARRIQSLHRQIVTVARRSKIRVRLFSGQQVRSLLLGDAKGTKHQIAELVAQQFPKELGLRLPPKRRASMNEDHRMPMFDAAALLVAYSRRRTAS